MNDEARDKAGLLKPIGNIPPAEFELTYYRKQDELAVAA
jgi:hypothetical protein